MFSNKARHIILFIFPLNKTSNLKKKHNREQPITYVSQGIYTKQISFLMTLFAVKILH